MSDKFTPKDLFDLSQDLTDEGSEAANRTIMNRCYYSCYLRIKKELYKKEGIGDYVNHDKVFLRVNRKKKRLGRILNLLYSSRLVADYSLNSYEVYNLIRKDQYKNDINCGTFNVDLEDTAEVIKETNKFHDFMDKL